jgi:hypothetical protein
MKLILLGFILFISEVKIFSQTLESDSIKKQTELYDSVSSDDYQEDTFQNSIDKLYDEKLDTFAWDNLMINSGHFDSKNMTDTVRIVLVDSLKHIGFVPPFKNYITSGFGPRWPFHFGVDIKLEIGDSVHAAFDGVVRVVKYDRRGYGRVVVIRHAQGLETIYGHLLKILVTTNKKVKAGDLIGLGGKSGNATGSHLHFETRYYGEFFDPNCFIDFKNFTLKSDTLVLTRSNFEYLVELRKAKYYTIKKGDTLGKIAHHYHTTIKNLCNLNRISSKKPLKIGRTIRYQ